MRLTVSLASLVLAGLALWAGGTRLRAPAHQLLDSDRTTLVAHADAQMPREAHILAGARTVGSIESLDAALNANTKLVVVDRSVAADAAAGSLRAVYLRGIPIMAINTSLADLWRLTGTDEDYRAVDPQFAADQIARARCDGDCAEFDFWSMTWRSCTRDPDVASGSGIGPFSPGHLTMREFDAQVRRQLALGSRCPSAE